MFPCYFKSSFVTLFMIALSQIDKASKKYVSDFLNGETWKAALPVYQCPGRPEAQTQKIVGIVGVAVLIPSLFISATKAAIVIFTFVEPTNCALIIHRCHPRLAPMETWKRLI